MSEQTTIPTNIAYKEDILRLWNLVKEQSGALSKGELDPEVLPVVLKQGNENNFQWIANTEADTPVTYMMLLRIDREGPCTALGNLYRDNIKPDTKAGEAIDEISKAKLEIQVGMLTDEIIAKFELPDYFVDEYHDQFFFHTFLEEKAESKLRKQKVLQPSKSHSFLGPTKAGEPLFKIKSEKLWKYDGVYPVALDTSRSKYSSPRKGKSEAKPKAGVATAQLPNSKSLDNFVSDASFPMLDLKLFKPNPAISIKGFLDIDENPFQLVELRRKAPVGSWVLVDVMPQIWNMPQSRAYTLLLRGLRVVLLPSVNEANESGGEEDDDDQSRPTTPVAPVTRTLEESPRWDLKLDLKVQAKTNTQKKGEGSSKKADVDKRDMVVDSKDEVEGSLEQVDETSLEPEADVQEDSEEAEMVDDEENHASGEDQSRKISPLVYLEDINGKSLGDQGAGSSRVENASDKGKGKAKNKKAPTSSSAQKSSKRVKKN